LFFRRSTCTIPDAMQNVNTPWMNIVTAMSPATVLSEKKKKKKETCQNSSALLIFWMTGYTYSSKSISARFSHSNTWHNLCQN
jgi:hypothetical protein